METHNRMIFFIGFCQCIQSFIQFRKPLGILQLFFQIIRDLRIGYCEDVVSPLSSKTISAYSFCHIPFHIGKSLGVFFYCITSCRIQYRLRCIFTLV